MRKKINNKNKRKSNNKNNFLLWVLLVIVAIAGFRMFAGTSELEDYNIKTFKSDLKSGKIQDLKCYGEGGDFPSCSGKKVSEKGMLDINGFSAVLKTPRNSRQLKAGLVPAPKALPQSAAPANWSVEKLKPAG